jgi:hypothetical protein
MVVAVVDNIVNVDGGCVGFISSDVAVLAGKGGVVTRAVGARESSLICVAISVVFVVVCIPKSMRSGVSADDTQPGNPNK